LLAVTKQHDMATEVAALIRELLSVHTGFRWRRQTEIENALVALGPAAVPELLEALQSSPWGWLRYFLFGSDAATHIVGALGRIGDPRAIAPLAVLAKQQASPLALPAVRALTSINDHRVVSPLAAVLNDQGRFLPPDVVCLAVQTLAELADVRDVDALCDALDLLSGSGEVPYLERRAAARDAVVSRLRELGDMRAIPRLLAPTNRGFLRVRTLVGFGAASIPELVRALDPKFGLDSERALQALVEWGERAVPALRAGVTGSPSAVTSRCAVALCQLGFRDESLISPVILAVEHSWSDSLALTALAQLSEEFNSPLLRRAIPTLRNLIRSGRVARSLLLADSNLETCQKILARIERGTGNLKAMPIVSSSRPRAADLPLVSDAQNSASGEAPPVV
jgi:HEAT repeat protein